MAWNFDCLKAEALFVVLDLFQIGLLRVASLSISESGSKRTVSLDWKKRSIYPHINLGRCNAAMVNQRAGCQSLVLHVTGRDDKMKQIIHMKSLLFWWTWEVQQE